MESQKNEQNEKSMNLKNEIEDGKSKNESQEDKDDVDQNSNKDENEEGEEEQDEEVHPPDDESSPKRAPRNYNNSGTILSVSNPVTQQQPFTNNNDYDEESYHELDFVNTATALFSFSGSRVLAHDSLSIEPDASIHGTPRKLFENFGSSSGYSDPIGENEEDGKSNKKRNAKGTGNTAQSNRQARNKNEKGGASKNQKYQKNQANAASRRKQNDGNTKKASQALLGSSSGSISESSSISSIPTSEISVSTLNPSDYSENFTPDMQNVLAPRFSNQPQVSKPIPKNSNNKTSQSARGLRTSSNSKLPQANIQKVKIVPPNRASQNKSINTRPSPPSRRRQQNGNTQSSLNSTMNSTASSSRRRRPIYLPPIKEEIPEPTEEMKKLIERAINKDKLDDLQTYEYEELISSLQQERRRKASDRSFAMGSKLNDALKYVKDCQLKWQKAERLKEATAEYNEQFEQLKNQIQEFDNETQKEKEDLKELQNQQKQDIIDNHKAQIDKLKEYWTSTNKVRMYNHASNSLTALKKKRKLLLMQARFNEAQEVDQLIKQKKKEEEVSNHDNYQQGYDASLRNLLEKQKSELEFFDETAKIQLDKLNQKRQRQRVAYDNQLKRFEARAELLKDADKLWNSEQFSRRENANTKIMMMSKTGPSGRINATDVQEGEDGDNETLELPPLDFRDKVEKKKEPKKKKHSNEEEDEDTNLDLGDNDVAGEIPNQ